MCSVLASMAEKSKILIIGGTGYIGKHIVEASAKAGHPTFALVRESTLSNPAKANLLDKFKTLGVNLVPVSYHINSPFILLILLIFLYNINLDDEFNLSSVQII